MSIPKFDTIKMIKNVGNVIKSYSPEIMTGMGIAGMITTVIFAVQATPKACELIKEKKALTPVDKVKAAWKCYALAAITGTLSTACIVFAASTNYRRKAALAAAYSMAESTVTNYKNAITDTVDSKTKNAIEQSVSDKTVNSPFVKNSNVVPATKITGDTMIVDLRTGIKFIGSSEGVQEALKRVNSFFVNGASLVYLSEFYDELGIVYVPSIAYELSWIIDDGPIDAHFDAVISDGVPCLAIVYEHDPTQVH